LMRKSKEGELIHEKESEINKCVVVRLNTKFFFHFTITRETSRWKKNLLF